MRLRNGTFLTVLLFCLCGLISLSWYTAFSNSKGKVMVFFNTRYGARGCVCIPTVCVWWRAARLVYWPNIQELRRISPPPPHLLSSPSSSFPSSPVSFYSTYLSSPLLSPPVWSSLPASPTCLHNGGCDSFLCCRSRSNRWRTKQNLDYCFLMMYAQTKGTYYVQLEDDIVARPNYFTTMKNFALQQPLEDWMILEFSQLGFIGKMFKSIDLSLIVEFMLMFYKDKPIDWLLDHIMWVKVCNPEKDAKHCDRQKANLRIRFKPSLFQHVGTHSSLAGKIQKLKDKDFGKQTLHKGHANPLAEVTTSLKTYQHFTLEKAYLGEDFFWAFTPVAGDFIRMRFFTPVRIEKYFFRSGNIEHPGDKLYNTSVEVLPFDNIQGEKEALREGTEKSPRYHRTEDGFICIGMFQNGIAEGEVDPSFGPLEAFRLTVLTDSPVWVILSEIFIRKAE
uniref:Alpha-1,3-mannosyl-glycoprotein 4-beta-N-acetylglucosaminyltransferase B n=1 Tax=Gadus morhua TaxID=8049 RepID=A0A8C5CVT9_GADMO